MCLKLSILTATGYLPPQFPDLGPFIIIKKVIECPFLDNLRHNTVSSDHSMWLYWLAEDLGEAGFTVYLKGDEICCSQLTASKDQNKSFTSKNWCSELTLYILKDFSCTAGRANFWKYGCSLFYVANHFLIHSSCMEGRWFFTAVFYYGIPFFLILYSCKLFLLCNNRKVLIIWKVWMTSDGENVKNAVENMQTVNQQVKKANHSVILVLCWAAITQKY
jgi:hypothetical protein